jgi:hypothetical protein
VEFGLGDGTVHRFDPGDVTLAEDLTGQGHTSLVVGSQPRLPAYIPLADRPNGPQGRSAGYPPFFTRNGLRYAADVIGGAPNDLQLLSVMQVS